MMPKDNAPALARFFAGYPADVEQLALALRTSVLTALPDAEETLDLPARIVGYGYGPGYKGLICTMIPSRKGVKLGVVRGTELPDPDGLLEGKGKLHRYVALAPSRPLPRAALGRLLASALEAWRVR